MSQKFIMDHKTESKSHMFNNSTMTQKMSTYLGKTLRAGCVWAGGEQKKRLINSDPHKNGEIEMRNAKRMKDD